MVNSAMETKNPARCTMSMSATHTSGFNTGSDNQNKWLLFPLYSTCQHSPLKGGGGGDARGLGSDVARPRPGPGRGAGPSPGRAPRPRAARINICFAGPGPGAAARAGRRRWRRSLRSPRSGARGGLRPGDRAARLGSLRAGPAPPRPGLRAPGLPGRGRAGRPAQASGSLPARMLRAGARGQTGPCGEVFGKTSREFEDFQSEPSGPGSRPGPRPPRQPQPRRGARRGGGRAGRLRAVDVTVEPAGAGGGAGKLCSQLGPLTASPSSSPRPHSGDGACVKLSC